MNPLCKVRTDTESDIKPGDFLARDGSWDRKYVVISIGEGVDEGEFWSDIPVIIRFLGRFYSDGREFPAKRVEDKEIHLLRFKGDPIKYVNGFYKVVPHMNHTLFQGKEVVR
jgi:hypothetical protein